MKKKRSITNMQWVKENRAVLLCTNFSGRQDKTYFYVELLRKGGNWSTSNYINPEDAIKAAREEIEELDKK